jgi:hypothetical protein
MRHIIKQAAADAGGPTEPSELDDVVSEVIFDESLNIEDTYTEVALASVELNRLAGAARSLVSAVDRLLDVTSDSPEDRDQLKTVISETTIALSARLDALE